MKYEFRTYEQDYLAYYMLNARENPVVIKKRKNAFLRLFLIAIAIIIYLIYSFFTGGTLVLLGLFSLYAIALLIYIIFFLNKRYISHHKKHYQKHIENNIKAELGRLTTIEVVEDKIHVENASSESKFNISELDLIWETPKHFFLKLLSGAALIIPKEDIKDKEQFRKEFNFVNVPIVKIESTEWQSIKTLFFREKN